MHPTAWHNHQNPVNIATVPPGAEDPELAMAINASIQSAAEERAQLHNPHSSSFEPGASSSSVLPPPVPPKTATSQWTVHEASHSYDPSHHAKSSSDTVPVIQMTHPPNAVPTAPPFAAKPFEAGTSSVDYPSVDSHPVDDVPSSSVENEGKYAGSNSSCVICLDAPVEGACVPCGHMAGCMSCLNEIKAKNWGCPVCRTKINQVIKLYAV